MIDSWERNKRRAVVTRHLPPSVSPLELGVALTVAIKEKFGAEVIDYDAGSLGTTTVRLRVPSRAERWARLAEQNARCVESSREARARSTRLMEQARACRIENDRVRAAVKDRREAMLSR